MEMGNSEDHGKAQIPIINFPKEIVGLDHEQGSTGGEEWKGKSGKMREAFEKYGCFILKCEENIPNYNMTSSSSSSCSSSREQIFMASKALFDLPDETKQKHTSSKPYRSYAANCPAIPLSESFGIDNGSSSDAVHSFTYLMWPQGNKAFCESVSYMAKKMSDLSFIILRMMLESLGMEKHYKSHVEGTSTVLRLMKYRVGPAGPASADSVQLGLLAHTDKSALTILCQNEVQGLELLTKQGTWLQVQLPEASFIVFVGDALKAWSNGRLHAATHRVMLKGDKDRYSCGLFLVPKEEVTIEVPQELIDKEHPLLYRPFKFSDYFSYFVSNCTEDALEIYAGV